MRSTALILFSLLAVPAAAQVAAPPLMVGPAPDGQRFVGGPFDGLAVGDVVDLNGEHFRGLLPSLPNASPVKGKDLAAIKAFLAGHADASKKPLSSFVSKDAMQTTCKRRGAPCQTDPLMSVAFGEDCTAHTPFRMGDGTVRVEWLHGKALYYISILTLEDGKITSVKTSPAWPPMQIGAIQWKSTNV